MSKAKVVLTARLNTKGFPFVNVKIRRDAIEQPVEIDGKVYSGESIQGFYVRYPHTVGNCLFPGCKGGIARHVQPLGKDHVDAYAQFQRIERDFTRIRGGKLPVEEVTAAPAGGGSLEEAITEFLAGVENKNRKRRTVEGYAKTLEQFAAHCGESGVQTLAAVDKKVVLGFVGWLKRNLETRAAGHPNNTFRNKLKDLRVFLKEVGHGMPLPQKEWPKAARAKKEKYSAATVKNFLAAADTVERRSNNRWTAEDDKDLVHFLLKTGWRDDEIAHAQYSDIDFKAHTVNVTVKPRGSFPSLPELEWMPKDSEARDKDIVVDEAFLARMSKRKERYGAKSNSLIFPNGKNKPDNHLIRVLQRLAREAGAEGRIGLHKFRKTFATLVAKEEGIEQARILLGHSDIATTQRYLAADEDAPEQDRKRVKQRFAEFGD